MIEPSVAQKITALCGVPVKHDYMPPDQALPCVVLSCSNFDEQKNSLGAVCVSEIELDIAVWAKSPEAAKIAASAVREGFREYRGLIGSSYRALWAGCRNEVSDFDGVAGYSREFNLIIRYVGV